MTSKAPRRSRIASRIAAFCRAFAARSLARAWAVLAGGGAAMTTVTGMLVRMRSAAASISLDDLALRQPAHVVELSAPPATPEWAQRLAEIGFIPGERVLLLARGRPGGDPLVVRIGDSTFALRRAEALCIQVEVVA